MIRRRRRGLQAALLAGPLCLAVPAASDDPEGDPEVGASPPLEIIDAIPAGPSLGSRLEEIRRRVQGALQYPPILRRRGIEGEAIVGFEIGADRSARGIRTEQSSGHPLLDRAAERAVRNAAPLPHVYGRVEVPVRFELDPRR